MHSRERLLTALAGGRPDRIPVSLFIVDQGHFINQMYPSIDPNDHETLQLKVIEFQREMGADVFVRLLYGVTDPISIHCGGLDVSQQTENWEVHTTETQRETVTAWQSTIKTPDGTLSQEFSRNEIRPGTFLYACTVKPIKTSADLDIAMRYEPTMPESFRQNVKRRIGRIKAALGDSGIVGVWAPHGPFNNASLLIDLDALYCLFITDLTFYEKLMTFAMNRALPYLAALDEAQPDVHCVGGNVPGGFLGKKTYDNHILRFEKAYIELVQKNGTPAMYHNCGQIMVLVDSYKELGAKVVEPFSPPPLGDCADLAATIQQIGGKYAVAAGVDQVNVIQKGTVDDVRRVTESTMKAAKLCGGAGFIFQNVDFLEYGTPPENVEAFVKTAREFSVL